jgi:hypothetical protein
MEIEIERVGRKRFFGGPKLGGYGGCYVEESVLEKIFDWSLDYDFNVIRKFLCCDETYMIDLREKILRRKELREEIVNELVDIYSTDEILDPEDVMDCDENIIFAVCEIWNVIRPVIGTYINNSNIRFAFDFFDWSKTLYYVNSNEAIIWIFYSGIKNGVWKNRWNRILSNVLLYRNKLLQVFVGEYIRFKGGRKKLRSSV